MLASQNKTVKRLNEKRTLIHLSAEKQLFFFLLLIKYIY